MEDPEVLEWIDAYLLGTLSAEDRVRLEARMSNDPQIAELVRYSREAFLAIQVARERQLREKLVEWDQKHGHRKNMLRRIWYWMFGSISVMLILLCSLSYIYAPLKLTSRYSAAISSPGSNSLSAVELPIWNSAQQEMMQGHLSQAKEWFSTFSEHPVPEIQQYATWQTLLCELGLRGSTPEWRDHLDTFVRQAKDPYKNPALQLQGITGSFFYRTTLQKISFHQVTYFKPSII